MGAISWFLNLIKDFHSEISWRLLANRLNNHKNSWIFLCNAHVGDTFVFCSFMGKFMEQHQQDDVTVVLRKDQEDVVSLFPNIREKVVFKKLPSTRVNVKMSSLQFKKGNLLPAHIYFSPAAEIKDYNYLDVFRIPLRLTRDQLPIPPDILQKVLRGHKRTDLFFINGRTALLSPYAKSVPTFPVKFWMLLVDELHMRGYNVATNVAGSETRLEGTTPVRFSLDQDGLALASNFSFFIGIRSGLCDVLHGMSCKMLVLYGDQEEKRYFSLTYTGYNLENLTEMAIDGNDERNYSSIMSNIGVILDKLEN